VNLTIHLFSAAEVKNAWTYTTILPYVFIMWRLINLLKPNDIYIYMSYRSANLQTLYFKYLFNK